jgi:hypothetical protein
MSKYDYLAALLQAPGPSGNLTHRFCTAEVAGSIPASPTLKILRFAGKTWMAVEGSGHALAHCAATVQQRG